METDATKDARLRDAEADRDRYREQRNEARRERDDAQAKAAKWFNAAHGLAVRLKTHRAGLEFSDLSPISTCDWLSWAVIWGPQASESNHRKVLGFFAGKGGPNA